MRGDSMDNQKKGHDIDFFRGNVDQEKDLQPNISEDTYSDFKFSKKTKKPIPNPMDYENINTVRYTDLESDQVLKKPLSDEDIDQLNRKTYKDPKLASGERKPIKPKSTNFENEPVMKATTHNGSNGNYHANYNGKSSKKRRNGNKPKKKRSIKKILLMILAFILIAIISLVGYLFYIKATAPSVNVVVIGVDQRKNQANTEIRADAIMSVSASTKDNKILVASVPRDTYVYLPCTEQYDKLAHSYFYGANNWDEKKGGQACTTQTVSQLFNIGTEKYAKVNFSNMVSIIDAIGGVSLKSTATFCEQDSQGKRDQYCFEEGKTYKMNGEEALAYSRHRKSDDDIQRGLRQQSVFKAMFKQVKNASIFEWPGIYTKVSLMLDTNLSQKEMLQIALVYATGGKMENFKFGWGGFYSNGISYVQLDENDVLEFTRKIEKLN